MPGGMILCRTASRKSGETRRNTGYIIKSGNFSLGGLKTNDTFQIADTIIKKRLAWKNHVKLIQTVKKKNNKTYITKKRSQRLFPLTSSLFTHRFQ